MTRLVISSFNVEWMNDWFAGDDAEGGIRFKETFKEKDSGVIVRTEIVATRVSQTIKKINPDILSIQEGPSRKEEMDLFINTYLDGQYSCDIGSDGRAQKIFFLYKKDKFDQVSKIETDYNPWGFDINSDFIIDDVKFTRSPLEMNFSIENKSLRLFGVHLKSPYINDGESLWNDLETRNEYIKESLINRRRLLTEAIAVRERMDSVLHEQPNVAIMGDLNDGPGKEYFEKLLLGLDITEKLLGDVYSPKNIFSLPYSLESDFTAIFDDFVENVEDKKLLLDRILISPKLLESLIGSKVEYEAYNENTEDANKREGRPSDHRPVSVTIDL